MNDCSEESEEDDERLTASKAPLVTARLILRRPALRDAEEIAPLADNMRIAQQTRALPHPYRQKDAEAWIATARTTPAARGVSFVMACKASGRIMGAAGYSAADEGGEAEIGYWVGEPFWGKGFATEAAQAIIDHAFGSGPFERVQGRCRAANAASRRVLEKCGFQYSGSGMCGCRALNSTVPSDEFVLERFVWVSLKRWGAA